MARNIRRRNRPTQSQPGLLDYIGEGWDALLDSGSPWFSPNHPAAIASRNIDWENPEDINDPDKREQLSIIGDSIGGGSNAPGALFGGGLLGGMVKKVPIKSGAKVKLKEGEDFQHLTLDNPPNGAPAYLQGSRRLEDVTGLFDLNKGGYPNVSQIRGDIFRPLKPHKEAADIVKVLKSSKQQKHLEEWFEEGAKQGGLEWYNTNHLKKFAIEQFGDDMGIQLYERFLRYNAALSPNTAVIPNIRQASYWNTLDELNVPFAEQIATRTLAPIPPTYGRMGLQSVKGLLASAKEGTKGPILLGGKNIKTAGVPKYAHDLQTIFPIGASKVNSFWENLLGNLSSATLDAGAMRAIAGKRGGVGKKATELRTSASKEIYGAVEDEFAKFAEKMGVAPAQAQASIWGGASKYTGVGKAPVGLPEGATWMEMLMSRVNKTALETGKSPKQVLTELLSGNQVLRSMVAPLLTTGAVGGGLLGKEEGL